jgi:predicted GIY-YIG superfamily endonuclease
MWKSQLDRAPALERENAIKKLQKQLREKELENQILREIVKKTSLVMDSGVRLRMSSENDTPSI